MAIIEGVGFSIVVVESTAWEKGFDALER